MRIRLRAGARLAGLVLLAAILALTLGEGLEHRSLVANQDKLEHFTAFTVLGFLFGWDATRNALLTYACVLVGVAGAIELIQDAATATRQAECYDFLASAAGVVVGATCSLACSPSRQS